MGRNDCVNRRGTSVPLLAALLVAGLVAGGCVATVENPLAAGGPRGGAPPLYHRLEVTNHHWDDMYIYATQGTSTVRLGLVEGNETRSLKLPIALAGRTGGVRLAARRRFGQILHYSETIHLAPGQTLGWSLEHNLKLSSHWVR